VQKVKKWRTYRTEPIVYYIDPANGDKMEKYIKAGIDDCVAFEAAGWKMLFVENIGQKMILQ
jgi:hypothetical protein